MRSLSVPFATRNIPFLSANCQPGRPITLELLKVQKRGGDKMERVAFEIFYSFLFVPFILLNDDEHFYQNFEIQKNIFIKF